MAPYVGKIEDLTLKNSFFRHVLFTGTHTQLVLMCLKPGEEIGSEVHKSVDQFFRFEEGQAQVIIDSQEYSVGGGDAVIVPAGSQHNIINIGRDDLKLYTLYSPPNHPPGTIHKTKTDADTAEAISHH